jgi:hypothetical protein
MILAFENDDVKQLSLNGLKIQFISSSEDKINSSANIAIYTSKDAPLAGKRSDTVSIDTVGEFGLSDLSLITKDFNSKLVTSVVFKGVSIFFVDLSTANSKDIDGVIKLAFSNRDSVSGVMILDFGQTTDSTEDIKKALDVAAKESEDLKFIVGLTSSTAKDLQSIFQKNGVLSEIMPVSDFKLKKVQDLSNLPSVNLLY